MPEVVKYGRWESENMKRAFEAIQNYPNIYIIIYFTVKLSVTIKMQESYSHSYVFDYNIFFLSILQSKRYYINKCIFFYIMFMVHW